MTEQPLLLLINNLLFGQRLLLINVDIITQVPVVVLVAEFVFPLVLLLSLAL